MLFDIVDNKTDVTTTAVMNTFKRNSRNCRRTPYLKTLSYLFITTTKVMNSWPMICPYLYFCILWLLGGWNTRVCCTRVHWNGSSESSERHVEFWCSAVWDPHRKKITGKKPSLSRTKASRLGQTVPCWHQQVRGDNGSTSQEPVFSPRSSQNSQVSG